MLSPAFWDSLPEGRHRRTTVDGLGRTVSVDERDDDVDPAVWRQTTYEHDAADHLTKVTDPAGNEITYDYNLAGWKTSATDPDSGTRQYHYDDAGNQIRVIDAENESVYTVYDKLGRPTARHTGNPAAPFATWDYDASTTEKGLLDKSTRHTPAGDWVTDITGYDARGRPTGKKVIVPAGVPGLSQPTTETDYPVTYGYDRGDNMTTVGYPAVGGLPAETLTTTYNTAGQAESLTSGLATYVSNATYDDRGSPDVVGLGSPGTMGTQYDYDADGWVSHVETYQGATEIADHTFTYDTIGNLTERTTVLGADQWRECFELDSRYRLDTAYTVDGAATCASGTPGTGDRPYDHDYTYSIDGNLTERVEDAATDTYTYPAAGQDRPHAPTQVGADTYQWDPNGNLETRTVDGITENLTWDPEQRLSTISGPSGTTSFVYDAGGSRLLRETPGGRTLYIDGHEITADTSGTTVTATRSYGFGGQTVATRTPAGVSYLVADQQGSVEASVTSGAIDVARTYDPYGDRRTGGELDTDQGWIGQIEDDTTDLAYLNARYYDPNIGTFISADPVYDTARPQTLNPYNYAMSNPVSLSDPSGLDPPWAWGRPDIKKPPRYFQLGYGNTNTGKALQAAAKAQARATGQSLEVATGHVDRFWQASYRARVKRLREKQALSALARANRDPGFWRALAAAGSGEALTLTGMRITNPDPGFWRMVSAFKSACTGSCSASDVSRVALNTGVNVIYGFSSDAAWSTSIDHAARSGKSCAVIDYACIWVNPDTGQFEAGPNDAVWTAWTTDHPATGWGQILSPILYPLADATCDTASVFSVASVPGMVVYAGTSSSQWYLTKMAAPNGAKGIAAATSKGFMWTTVAGTGVDIICRIVR